MSHDADKDDNNVEVQLKVPLLKKLSLYTHKEWIRNQKEILWDAKNVSDPRLIVNKFISEKRHIFSISIIPTSMLSTVYKSYYTLIISQWYNDNCLRLLQLN
jgi:hypothetical protein